MKLILFHAHVQLLLTINWLAFLLFGGWGKQREFKNDMANSFLEDKVLLKVFVFFFESMNFLNVCCQDIYLIRRRKTNKAKFLYFFFFAANVKQG